MNNTSLPEYWLRGPLPGVPPLLQPVAHALLQAQEEIVVLMTDFNGAMLWQRPAGCASAGFHLQHLSGVLDRLFTYAKGQPLTAAQLQQLAAEGKETTEITVQGLLNAFQEQIEKAMAQLRNTDEQTLIETRTVGRAGLPATVLGLLVHAAEHTMRHAGQLLVTVRVLMAA